MTFKYRNYDNCSVKGLCKHNDHIRTISYSQCNTRGIEQWFTLIDTETLIALIHNGNLVETWHP